MLPSNDVTLVRPRNVTITAARYGGSDALEVRLSGPYLGPDKDTFAFVPDVDFHDGTIEVDVAGSRLPDAPPGARGFVGITFRVDATGGRLCLRGILHPADQRPRRRPGSPQPLDPVFLVSGLRFRPSAA